MQTPGDPREAALHIVTALQRAGHVAYFAGGCVRDCLLGLVPKDYDVATSALPEQVHALFPRSRYVGEAFGVVLVRQQRRDVEVATFRIEWGYHDNRRPAEVRFTDAEHDAQRRDFTINGLFEDPLQNQIIDYVGGQADLQARVLRAIGVPEQRFGEDYLRMLRAVRFTARFGFTLDPATAAAIRRFAPQLGRISRERIGGEMVRMLTPGGECNIHQAVELMQTLALDAPALTEPATDTHVTHTLAGLQQSPAAADYPAALAAWLVDRRVPVLPARDRVAGDVLSRLVSWCDANAAADVNRWRTALCLSNEHTEDLTHTLTVMTRLVAWPMLPKAQRKRLLAERRFAAAQAVLSALTHRPDSAAAADLMRSLSHDAPPLQAEGVRPEPWLTGNDLIQLGARPGPQFKTILDDAYDRQLTGELTTRDQALQWLSQRLHRT